MSLPTPYYDHDGITIYHGDCREILPHLPEVDMVLTDPPYIGLKGGLVYKHSGVAKSYTDSVTVGDPWNASLDFLAEFDRLCQLGAFVFCSYHFVDQIPAKLPSFKRAGLVTWQKRNSPYPVNNVPHFTTELIWAFRKGPGLNWRSIKTHYDIPLLQAGCMASERIVDETGKAQHPAQKPIEPISNLLIVGGDSILDPFMGSGTTLIAAKNLNRKAIGIEIEEKYCEIAVKRLAQEVLPL